MARKRSKITCPLCGEKMARGVLRRHKMSAHGEGPVGIGASKKRKKKKDKGQIKTIGPGARAKNSDWRKVK